MAAVNSNLRELTIMIILLLMWYCECEMPFVQICQYFRELCLVKITPFQRIRIILILMSYRKCFFVKKIFIVSKKKSTKKLQTNSIYNIHNYIQNTKSYVILYFSISFLTDVDMLWIML